VHPQLPARLAVVRILHDRMDVQLNLPCEPRLQADDTVDKRSIRGLCLVLFLLVSMFGLHVVVMSSAELAGNTHRSLGEKVVSLKIQRNEIIAALDLLFTGI